MSASLDSSITFGQWLKRRRRSLQLTQDALAAQVGYTGATLQKLEQGVRRPSRALAALLADALALGDADRAQFFQLTAAPPEADEAGGAAEPGAAEPTWARPQAPPPPMPLIGRAAEHADLLGRLCERRQRLVTLVGPGGMGKTSLALQVAADRLLAQHFPDGVALVPLAAIAAAAQVPQAIAAALGLSLPDGRPLFGELLDALRGRSLLLILDNCEQLLDRAGETLPALLARLLAGAPGLSVLATSRERLRLHEERVMLLGGLDLPAADSWPRAERAPAVQLFVERARRVSPDFAPVGPERADVVRLCRRLGGMPLAIELAAAWTRALTPREIADELDRSLDVLTSDAHDVAARHRSVRAALDHSWRMLDGAERHALAGLSVIQGSCDREAAAAVAGASLPLLSALIDTSLVRRSSRDGATRYDLHQLVRQYAAERLAAEPALRQAAEARHAAHYAALLQRAVTQQTGGLASGAWASLARDLDNVRAAWVWAAEVGDAAACRGMARGLMILYDMYGWRLDAAALFGQAAAALRPFGTAADAARGVALGLQGYFLLLVRPAAAPALLQEGIALLEAAGDDEGRAELLLHYGTAELAAANFAAARERYREAAALATGGGNSFVRLWATLLGGNVELYSGSAAAAQERFSACLAEWRGQGVDRGVITALSNLSEAALYEGRLAEAEAYAQESLRISSTIRDTPGVGRTLHDLGALAMARGDISEAYYLLAESCTTLRAIGDTWPYGLSRALLVAVEARRGQLAEARRGCAELLGLVYDGIAMLLPSIAYGLAELLAAEGRAPEALAVLLASASTPGTHDSLAARGALRAELERRLGPEGRAAAQAMARRRPLLALLEELCAPQPAPAAPGAAPAPDERPPPPVPAGGLYIDETGEALSPREVEVLCLLMAGMGNQAIATALVISVSTTKHHVASILQKLGVPSRTAAALRGRALGLSPRPPGRASQQ